MIFDKPLAALRERLGRPDVDKALLVTGPVGGVVFIALMVGADANL